MDIVCTSIASGSFGRRHESGAHAALVPLLAHPSSRAPMIFLIANMGYKIPANSLKTHTEFCTNRQFSWDSLFLPAGFEDGKTEPFCLADCAKIDWFLPQERLALV
jgi:hypothetical protein